MAELTLQRESLARFQHELLLRLRGSTPEDPWWREQLVDPVSRELLTYLQAAMGRTLTERLALFFPRFTRHAGPPPRSFHDRVRVAVVCAPLERGLDAFFAGALELCEGFDQPPAWRDLLRLERAQYLARIKTPMIRAELVAALRNADEPQFDDRGVDDRGSFGFVHLDTNMVDLWLVPDRSPAEAHRWGPPRQALWYWSLERHALRVVSFESLRELSIRLAVQG